MNASPRHLRVSGFALAVFLAGLAAAPFALAGPGSQYWRNSAETKSAPAIKASATLAACNGCSDMKIAAVTSVQREWSNGRGPLQTFTTGIEQVCGSCGDADVALKPSWSNGRGPLTPVALKHTHLCSTSLTAALR